MVRMLNYHLSGNCKIIDSMLPLDEFEVLFADDAVSEIYEFEVEGAGLLTTTDYYCRHPWSTHGVFLQK